jgi:maleate cis-trans isomerase
MVGLMANRAQFGLILPSTNTSVEAEFNAMSVLGKADWRWAARDVLTERRRVVA